MTTQEINKTIETEGAKQGKSDPLVCGLIMPISAIDGCPQEHWADVKAIISEAVEAIPDPRFRVRLVSDADDIGVIQKRIVQNVYNADIVICDVSAKNPNVMFELGMRLAFDRPTVIVKDDKTDYSFDTGIIEHVPYPRDLRYNRIEEFKTVLSKKVVATHRVAQVDSEHSPFLKNFGKFQVAVLSQEQVPGEKMIIEMLSDIQQEVTRIRRNQTDPSRIRWSLLNKMMAPVDVEQLQDAVLNYLQLHPETSPGELIGNKDAYKQILQAIGKPLTLQQFERLKKQLEEILFSSRDLLSIPDSAQ